MENLSCSGLVRALSNDFWQNVFFEKLEFRAILWAKQSITCTTMNCLFFEKHASD
jgi:hypothetical protein